MKNHPVKLSDEEKVAWFKKCVDERQRTAPLKTEAEFIEFIRSCRRSFKSLYGRDVSGSFFRVLLKDFGIVREQSEATKAKKAYIHKLLDSNEGFRWSKSQLRKAVDAYFGEKILTIVFDELWDEYFDDIGDRPKPKMNVDLHGQTSLFDE